MPDDDDPYRDPIDPDEIVIDEIKVQNLRTSNGSGTKESSQYQRTEKSLNRSISGPFLHKEKALDSLHDSVDEKGSGPTLEHNDIEIQLENALMKEQEKTDSD